ncbi:MULTISPECIES: TrbI/VirB10 family protein [Cyanophyceae]|uniref:TrbI/VirB10 family protein n=2 Tax=Cyanobacteriota TaxID=1117 RepID=UPI00232C3189|nr:MULTISPECIES: TrbI/VirB10 family protein [Cyanophyceae]MDB9355341.1 TrbI/VirB10 family protein [Nodularia spumigena CS-587/03]MDB9338638.1 TrbI/VirB10 family protein [Nodularia spumigena CS-589/07]MDB9349619.1 TrbI/VirB10 family protein [Nodularia spumigena CS-588/01]MDB9354330.1 TrbI/VirB10 family protein [Nodularia spumigena CS-588/05]MDB9398480.1 TrbI/VirB10 family protein [Microcystis aeruginosa CS-567/02-A1]
MTSYSIHPEFSTKHLIKPIPEQHEPEVDASDWESRMAKLVGFQEESPQINVDAVEADSASLQPFQSQPQEVQTEQSLSSNPFAKLALVGSATLAVVVVAGAFLSQIMNTSNQRPRNNLVSSTAPLQVTSESLQQNLAEEVEILKTKLALAEQAQTVTAAQQNLRNRVAARVETQQVREATPRPVQTASTPRVVTVERIIEIPASPPVAVPPIAIAPTPPPAPVATPVTQVSPPDPLEEWTRLAKLGSYGQVNTTGQSRVNTALSVPKSNPNVEQVSNSNPEPTPPQPDILVRQLQSAKSVKVGSSAKAVLATALFGETTKSRNNESNEDGNVFVLRLTNPLKSVDGAIALPANTELLAEIISISEKGLLQLNVVKMVSEQNGELIERNLPKNAIMVRAPQGKPLVASQYPDQGASIAGMDVGLFVLGGIGKGAELFNRTESQVSIEGSSTIVTNTNNRRNIPAGILEGGLKSVVPQIAQRNQQAITEMIRKTNVWFIPAGKEVEIYVNKTMQL